MVPPNFFIIGAPKCGTTALAQYLSEHPNVVISVPKEPQYFDFDLAKPIQPTLEEYLGYFSKAQPGIHTAVGEASTSHLFSKRAVPEILKFDPEAKFIVMLRNPVDLVYSWHSEIFANGTEDVWDFEKAWRLEKDRARGKHLPPFCIEKDRLRYSEIGKLGEQMERLLSLVRREKLLVIIYDDFVAKTPEIYQETLKFLGVHSEDRKEFPRINESKTLRWPWIQKYLVLMATVVWKTKMRLGVKFSSGILSRMILSNRIFKSRPPLREEFRAELDEFFRTDVEKLGKLLGRDFSYWLSPSRK